MRTGMPTFNRLMLAAAALLLLAAGKAFPQSFSASVDKTTVAVGEQFQVSFTFSGQDINGIKGFKPPDFKGFMIMSGPNQSSSMQFVNGAVSASMTYSYYIQPRSPGKFTIGPAEINYNGKTIDTQPLAITVVKGAPGQAQSSQPGQTISSKDIGDNLFILATADKQKAYLGEQVVVTYKLYTRLSIASFQPTKLPSYEGLWSENLTVPTPIPSALEMYKGKQYRVYTINKVALFPTQVGELSVTPLVLDIPVQVQQRRSGRGDIFDQFFNDPFFNSVQVVNYTAKSNTIRLHVVPLPSRNVPASFDGAVGNYTMTSSISSSTAKTNEPLSLKINLAGKGNIQLLDMPEVKLPAGFDKYPPKTTEQIDRSGTISGSKSFEYLLVPRDPGTRVIPPIEFSYFNPAKESYATLSTPSYTVNVTQGPAGSNGSIAGYTKEEIKLLGQDIRYIKTSNGDLRRDTGEMTFGFGFWSATLLPLFALTGLVTWKRKQDRLAGNVQLLRYRRAEKIARTRFRNAKELMGSGNQSGFYAEISQAIFGYLEDKLHIPKAELSTERAAAELEKNRIRPELIENLKSYIDKCEFARFAPESNGAPAMFDMYRNLTNVIIELERSLSPKKNA